MLSIYMQELRTLQMQLHHTIANIDTTSASLPRRQLPQSETTYSPNNSEILHELAKVAKTRRRIEFDHLRALQESERNAPWIKRPIQTAPIPQQSHFYKVEKAIESLRQQKELIKKEIQNFEEFDAKRIPPPNTQWRATIESKQPFVPPENFSVQGFFTCNRSKDRHPMENSACDIVSKPSICSCSMKRTHPVNTIDSKASKTLQEVYQIQLQFAQTIQNLERSIDARGKLLHQPFTFSSSESDSSYRSSRRQAEPNSNTIPSNSKSVATTTPSTEEAFSEEKLIQTSNLSVDDRSLRCPEDSYEKQVRFNDQEKDPSIPSQDDENEYSTPKIARNIVFDNVEEDEEGVSDASKLSFMQESQSSEVTFNDESFLCEFERLRSEVRGRPEKNSEVCDSMEAVEADLETLKQKRIDICMEIQEETTHLALLSCDFSSTQKSRLKRRERLMRLRDQFSQVEKKLNAIRC